MAVVDPTTKVLAAASKPEEEEDVNNNAVVSAFHPVSRQLSLSNLDFRGSTAAIVEEEDQLDQTDLHRQGPPTCVLDKPRPPPILVRRDIYNNSERSPLLARDRPRRVSYGADVDVAPTPTNQSDDSNYGSDNTEEESSSDDFFEEQPAFPSCCVLTARQLLIFFLLMLATLTSSFAVCLFPPFFPRLAEEKGETAAVYGFVIGTNCLTSFLVTPSLGKNLTKWGVRYSLIWGMFMGGVCCALSGFLEFFNVGYPFVLTAVAIRIVHATGNALVITATFTYSAIEFPKHVAKIFSFTRTAMNLAQLLGPVVGGAIYQAGGFYLPFVTMGAMQGMMGFISFLLLPEIRPFGNDTTDARRSSAAKKVTITNMLKIPTIWISFVTFIVATVCNGFLSINLEPKVLRWLELSQLQVGLLFGIKDGANSISSPVWGYLCDKSRKKSVKPYIIFSAILVAASFFLMGGGSFAGFDFKPSVSLLLFALCLNGVGVGGEQVAGVVDALHEAVNAGYPDDPVMHGLVAGLWSSLSGAGRFVSRVGSGILVDLIGFDSTAAIVTGLQATIAGLTMVYMIFCECTIKTQSPVRWDDVTIIEEGSNEELVFTESGSPSESLMGKTVSIDVPKARSKGSSTRNNSRSTARSLPPRQQIHREMTGSVGSHTYAHSLLPDMAY